MDWKFCVLCRSGKHSPEYHEWSDRKQDLLNRMEDARVHIIGIEDVQSEYV